MEPSTCRRYEHLDECTQSAAETAGIERRLHRHDADSRIPGSAGVAAAVDENEDAAHLPYHRTRKREEEQRHSEENVDPHARRECANPDGVTGSHRKDDLDANVVAEASRGLAPSNEL